ncbi:hypothetical protein A3K69_02005 [Candidatus Bathyarchaeota archaeon RBG_16_57_9]|nr:MAG: hypothetical protein A3K69_02005 [Candidatus Bathyarchaeota archaeon RBG_16_57_9]OGD55278.1 MAG: hypothetical protein A3K81_06475 [Candidatus Bathyarchaeota archaeon RBG_13_60_20]
MSFKIVRLDILLVFFASFVTLLISSFVLKGVKLRQIPTVEASLEAVRVSTEKGTPLFFDTGWTGANFWGHSSGLTTLAFVPSTLELLKVISKEAGSLGVRIITGTTNAVYAMMSQDYMEAGFGLSGHPERFNLDDINFYPDNTGLVMSGVEKIHRFNIGAAVMVGGHNQTSNIVLYEALATTGAMLVAGEIWPNDNSMAALCADYLSFAEENIAIGAYLSEDPVPKAILAGEDIIKAFLIGVITIGGVLFYLGVI